MKNEKNVIDKIIRENIIKVLDEKEITQRELARQLDITPQCLNNYLRGRKGFGKDLLNRISLTLEVPVSVFYDEAKKSNHYKTPQERILLEMLKSHGIESIEGLNKTLQVVKKLKEHDIENSDVLDFVLEDWEKLKKSSGEMFGTLIKAIGKVKRKARKGRNPQTGDIIKITNKYLP